MNSLLWLENLPRFSLLKYNLYRVWLLLRECVPEYKDLQVFFITGSKGKGTVAVTLAAILDQAGVAAGLITSPHLLRVTERISFGGQDIPEALLAEYLDRIRRALPPLPGEYGTWIFGEIILAVALLWFRERGASALVVEAGLGGRLDAGNVFRRPLATCITNVSLEHQGLLGDTVAGIAREKAGIIKPGVPLVTGARGEALAVLQQRGERLGAPLFLYGQHFSWLGEDPVLTLQLPCYSLGLDRAFSSPAEKENAALAACLAAYQGRVTPAAIAAGILAGRKLPGRFEILPGSPVYVLDVAHTPEAVVNLREALQGRFPGEKIAFVAGFLADKKATAMLALMAGMGPVFLAPVKDSRSYYPAADQGPNVVESIEAGLAAAKKLARVVCVTGSFAAVREAKTFLDLS